MKSQCGVLGIIVGGWLASASASAQDVDIQSVVRETQITRQNANTLDLVWWMPTEFWAASFRQSKNVPAKQQDELIDIVDDYIVISVLESTIGTLGVMSSTVKDELTKKTMLYIDGVELRPIPEAELKPEADRFIKLMKPGIANMIGQMGQGMHFLAFKGRSENGRPLVDATKPGRMSVKVGDKEFVYRLPVAALLPPRFDKDTGERFPGTYEFNPYTGKKLTSAQ